MERRVGIVDELASSWPTKEVANGGVEVDVDNLPSSADASTVIISLLKAERHWKCQKKKAIWLKLPSEYYHKFLHPAHEVGFRIHCTKPTYMMLILWLEKDESNASNQIGVGPCVGSNATLQQIIDPDRGRSTLGQSYGSLGHQSDATAINATFPFPPSVPVPTSPVMWKSRPLHGHENLVAAETGGTSSVELDPGIHPALGLTANLVPPDMGNKDSNTEANDHGVEVINVSEPNNQSRRRALTPDRNSALHTKRSRGPNWTDLQKRFLLKKKLHYQEHLKHTTCKSQDTWFQFVSKSYLEEHGIEIEPGRWQCLMDTLKKQFKAIRAYEEKVQSGTSACVSFWNLGNDGRSDACRNWDKKFDHEMYQLVEKINQNPEANLANQKTRDRQAGALAESSSKAMTATISDPAGPSSCHHEFQVSTESPLPLHDISPDTQESQQLDGEKLNLPVNSLLRRSDAFTFDENQLVSSVAPFVKKQIEDALQPLHSAWRKREEDEEKHREKMLATQADQLDLLRQDLQLTRIVFANSMGNVYGVASSVNPILGNGQRASSSYFSDEPLVPWNEIQE